MTASCEWVDVGSGLKAYYGKPAGAGPHPCLVVYIEAFGVNEHFKKLTQRLADQALPRLHRTSMEVIRTHMTIWVTQSEN